MAGSGANGPEGPLPSPPRLSPMGESFGGQQRRPPRYLAGAPVGATSWGPRDAGRQRRGWRKGLGAGSPPSDCIWPIAPWRRLLIAGLMLACVVQGTDHRTTAHGPGHGLQPRRHWRQLGHGAWTHWGSWSACSSTCGEGASFRARRCIRFPEEEPCKGKARQYRVCQLEGCPQGAIPFRAVQCSLYNGKSVLGGQGPYRWVPFHGAPSLCDLNCLAEGHNFYYTFGRVLDGTPCSPESRDLCISGRCLRAGCDGILGSEAQADACGMCDGRNESCVLVQAVFQAAFPASGFFGYKNVTRIPAGARHIKVVDRSRNYLALMDANQRYVLNGDWAINWPGEYEVAGTRVHYRRTADLQESLEAEGPTQEDLLVMVLVQEPHPGVEYQFWLPRGHLHPAQSDTSPLRQPQVREAEGAPAPTIGEPHRSPGATAVAPHFQNARRSSRRKAQGEAPPGAAAHPGRCGECQVPRGRSQRIHHYCNSDFVFRARILSKQLVGQETRYDLQVREAYRNRVALRHREYLWVADTCDCPPLTERREYVLMARQHVNFEHTRNRLLLPRGAYARPWSPREDLQLRDAAQRCGGLEEAWRSPRGPGPLRREGGGPAG
ncbi:ADAMTS-like protein 5 isoform X1 [Pogona vitticeps]